MSFGEKVSAILKTELPSARSVFDAAKSIADGMKIGRSAFFDKVGVSSEVEYKRRCIKEGRIMYHAHIGMSTWADTSQALKRLDAEMDARGSLMDRAGICLDRRMALPPDMRASAPAEPGPSLDSDEDWNNVAQAAPIQPHMGDFMIGFPASAENAPRALRAGVTTIGNLSQFFSHEAPMWKDTVYTTRETAIAIALMGRFREQGTLFHSYLDDGFGALFFDSATVGGWALIERYIVEELLGAKLGHCMGGLISDPIKRSGWIFALDELHDHDCIGTMFYGDTISFTHDFDKNRGMIAEYMFWDIMTQLECPTGHAVLPVPVTEAVRVPTIEEIIEAQAFGRRIEEGARRMHPYFDFSAPKEFARKVCDGGRRVYEKAMAGLADAGVDMKDPVQLLYVLKRLGPAVFEEMFGAGTEDADAPRGHVPVAPNDVFVESDKKIRQEAKWFDRSDVASAIRGRRFLLASTDVHEHALYVMRSLIKKCGGVVTDIGPEKDPDEVAAGCLDSGADVLLVSTHNGMALEYARMLLEELEERGVSIPIVMGGVLNQKVEELPMPIDVDDEIAKLGIKTSRTLESLAEILRETA